MGDEDAGVKIVGGDVLGEGAHLLDADGGVGGEFHPDGADRGGWRVGVGGGGGGDGVFGYHCFGGFGLEGHFAAAALVRDMSVGFLVKSDGRGLVEKTLLLWGTTRVGVVGPKVIERDVDFVFCQFVALHVRSLVC